MGALLLTWGLAVAPVLHVVFHEQPHTHRAGAVHDESKSHDHDAPGTPAGDHGADSLEHSQFLTHGAPSAPSLVVVFFAVQPLAVTAPAVVALTPRLSPEQPQGP